MRASSRSSLNRESGFTLIDMLFVMAIMGVVVALAIPGLMRARGSANAASTIGTLRLINSAQLSYAITCGFGFYAADFETLGTKPLNAVDAFLPNEMSSAPTFQRAGYIFSLAGTPEPASPPTCNGMDAGSTATGYAVVADPLDKPAKRYFGTNADGILYEHLDSLSSTMPEVGKPAKGSPIK